MSSRDRRAIHLDLRDPDSPSARLGSLSDLTDAQQREFERVSNTPEVRARAERLKLVASRGQAVIAIQEEPLDEGAIALVRHDPANPGGRMIVLSDASLTDEALARARHALFSHELKPETDSEAAELTIWPDGRVRICTASGVSERRPNVRIFNAGRRALAQAIRARLPSMAPSAVAGLKTVRVIDPRSLERPALGG